MQAKKEVLKEDKTSYSFILDMLAAVTVGALIAAAAIALIVAKASAIIAAGLAAKTLFAATVAASIVMPPILPVGGIILFVAALFILPFMFSGNNYNNPNVLVVPATRPGWGGLSFFNTPFYNHHHHGGYGGGSFPSHSGGAVVHNYPGTGNNHHGGGGHHSGTHHSRP